MNELPNSLAPSGGPRCRTRIVADIPSETDAFGSHSRIAEAIAQSIEQDEGGRSIGIAGRWGSGKSTVVRLLRERLRAREDIHIWTFDAWAHEGDPLRRTFLEDLISWLLALDWLVDKAHWTRIRDGLSKRVRRQRTRTRPRLTVTGYLVAIGLLAVPFGSVLLNAAVSHAVSVLPIGGVGAAVVAAVLLMLAPAWLPLLWWGFTNTGARVPLLRRWFEATPFLDAITPLARVHHTDVRSETAEDPEPTSIEFSKIFRDVMRTALTGAGAGRRLVIVLDNLDRVASEEQSQRIWATLQPYLQPAHDSREWQDRVWIIITYDPLGIGRLTPDDTSSNDDGARSDRHGQAVQSHQKRRQSYIDKTIRVEYQVPLPVLSDWRKYLGERLVLAFPDHDAAERAAAVRAIAPRFPSISTPPTPRELVQIVNSMGAYHRQWCGGVPLVHIAHHVLHARLGEAFDTPLPPHLARSVGPGFEDDRYILQYWVQRPVARQMRIGDQALTALADGDEEAFRELAASTEGLWPVIEVLLHRQAQDWLATKPSSLLRALGLLSQFHDHPAPEREACMAMLRRSISHVEEWDELDRRTDAGVSQLLDAPHLVAAYIARRAQLLEAGWDDLANDKPTEVASIAQVLAQIPPLKGVRNGTFRLTTPAVLRAFCSALPAPIKKDVSSPVWTAIGFDNPESDIIEWLFEADPDATDIFVVRALAQSGSEASWDRASELLEPHLARPSSATPYVFLILLELLAESPVKALVKRLSAGGQWQQALVSEPVKANPVALGAGICCVAHVEPTADLRTLNALPQEVQRKAGRAIWTHSRRGKTETQTWAALSGAGVPLVFSSFAMAAAESNWSGLTAERVRRASAEFTTGGVLGEVVQKADLAKGLAALLRDEGFDLRSARLYRSVCEIADDPAFDEWLSTSITQASEDQWVAVLESRSSPRDLAQLLVTLSHRGVAMELPASIGPILSVRVGKLGNVARHLVPWLAPAALERLGSSVYELVTRDGALSHAYTYEDYGPLLSRAPQLRNVKVPALKKVVIPIIKNTTYPVTGLEWLASTLEVSPDIVARRGRLKRMNLLSHVHARLKEPRLSKRRKSALERIERVIKGTL